MLVMESVVEITASGPVGGLVTPTLGGDAAARGDCGFFLTIRPVYLRPW